MIALSILWLHLLFHLEPFSVNPIAMGKLSDQIGKKGFKQFLHSQQHPAVYSLGYILGGPELVYEYPVSGAIKLAHTCLDIAASDVRG